MDDDLPNGEPAQWWKMAVLVAAVGLLVGVTVWLIRSIDDEAGVGTSSGAGAVSDATAGPSTATTGRLTATTEPSETISTSIADESSSDTVESSTPTTSSRSAATTTAGTTVAPASSPPPGRSPGPGSVPLVASYPTAPDGSPLPLVVIFDVDTITVSGQVPSRAARDRLAALAIANSQFPDAELVDNMVINPDVPIGVGVRVIELNSARFPEGSAQILPEHAKELDRVVNVMNALPNVSVLVIGHADQRGDEGKNFALSDERARAVVNYFRFLGISPTRLASRAAGESDLLTTADDEFALALNRRTEFIFSGLLVE